MILSVSRRTDIPCYYSDWFINRLKEGFVYTRNPMNHAQIKTIPLSSDLVDCIVFWTKDANNLMPYLKTIDDMNYRYYFQFTITPYDQKIEVNLRDKNDIEDTFINLSNLIGKQRVLWRYDPIILNDEISIDYHKQHFARMCEKLSPYTNSVTISFVDIYSKIKSRFIRKIEQDEMLCLAEFMSKTAKDYNLKIKACSEVLDFKEFGIEQASCIDANLIEEICGYPLKVMHDKNQRANCGCVKSTDIGIYNTCLNGCVYCYANFSAKSANKNYQLHDVNASLLIGNVLE